MNSIGRILLTVVSTTTACAFAAEAPPGRGDPTVTDQGPFHRTLHHSVPEVMPDGKVTTRESEVIELASGMHRRTEAGEWVTASAELTLRDHESCLFR